MRHPDRRQLSSFTLASALLLGLAACGGGDGTDAVRPDALSSGGATPQATGAPMQAPARPARSLAAEPGEGAQRLAQRRCAPDARQAAEGRLASASKADLRSSRQAQACADSLEAATEP